MVMTHSKAGRGTPKDGDGDGDGGRDFGDPSNSEISGVKEDPP